MRFLIAISILLTFAHLVTSQGSPVCSKLHVPTDHECMAMALYKRRGTAVFVPRRRLSSCYICNRLTTQNFPSLCAGPKKKKDFCIGYPFRRVSNPLRQLLLFRAHQSNRESVFEFFMRGQSNRHLLLTSPSIVNAANYKSPLFSSAHEVGVTQVELQMLTSDGEVAVRLRFDLRGSLTKDKWFSKARLRGSYPWSLAEMKRAKYNYFSIAGLVHGSNKRRFYISKSFNGCPRDKGYMIVSESEGCTYYNELLKPAYIWNPDSRIPWAGKKYRDADVIQVIGFLHPWSNMGIYSTLLRP